MKSKLPITIIIGIASSLSGFSQGAWTKKADFGGTVREITASFSIGAKGYVGTGRGNNGVKAKDFWEWDQTTNTWTQKADFGGTARIGAAGFSIGTKGYIGLGEDGTSYALDFWEWDQATNIWTQKANFIGAGRRGVSSFSIGGKGYIGTGYNGNFLQDFWEWDQVTNIWLQKANFPGTGRYAGVGFSIGTKGYISTGMSANPAVRFKDLWEWDQSSDTWTQKADMGGVGRFDAVGFSIGTKGYVGTGAQASGPSFMQDFWEWDQTTDSWIQRADFGGTGRSAAFGFSIAGKGYIGGGGAGNPNLKLDFWEWYSLSTSASVIHSPCLNQCNGSAVVNASGGVSPYTYSWNISPIQTTATATGICAGMHSVTITDSLGYSATTTVSISPLPPPASIPICMVTVDSTSNRNLIVWEKPAVNYIDSFRIYRDVASLYTHIGSVSYASFSVFADTTNGINPALTSYRYKISVKDTCGVESPLSTFHKTIHLQVGPASPIGYNLNWDDYIGMNVSQYRILFDSTKTGNWQVMDSVPFGITSYTDPTIYHDTVAYMIEVIHPGTCSPTIIKNESELLSYDYKSTRSNWNKILINSVSELQNNIQINIAPNPSKGIVTVKSNTKISSIEILNLLGEKVYALNHLQAQSSIDLSSEPNGVYFVHVSTNDGNAIKKIIIAR